MYEFPPSEKLAFLLDEPARLIQIALNAASLRLVFDNDCYVDVGLNMTYVRPDETRVAYAKEWFAEKPLEFHVLLDQDAISLETDGLEMRIGFSRGGALLIYSDIGPYEAVTVAKRGGPEFYI
ncbi:hypothetical protein [Brevundimonas sp.]|uniref:hypothetical protein n=1 Tax=Brevundimonas sp. TaxID=1871086 RepID=UPI002D408DF5|nr:hypothetical protein [Brevundimonas sp.]HYC98322.1 hypothetical protein [Brevundimonas sp.]